MVSALVRCTKLNDAPAAFSLAAWSSVNVANTMPRRGSSFTSWPPAAFTWATLALRTE